KEESREAHSRLRCIQQRGRNSSGSTSLSINQDHKAVRENTSARMRVVRSWGRWRAELRRHRYDVMGFFIQGHSPRALLGRNVAQNGEFVRRFLFNYRKDTLATGGKSQVRAGVEGVGIHAVAY